jgi:hypothetical protein
MQRTSQTLDQICLILELKFQITEGWNGTNISEEPSTKLPGLASHNTMITIVTRTQDLTWYMWSYSYFILKWSNVKWATVNLGDKSAMYITVTLYWGYLIVLCLFHLVCILYCGCFNLCNVWVCVCGGFVMNGYFVNMCTCIYCVLYCLYCVFVLFRLCIFILICFVCTSVRTTDTEWQLNCS